MSAKYLFASSLLLLLLISFWSPTAIAKEDLARPSMSDGISLEVRNIKFDNLIVFEEDLLINFDAVTEVTRESYSEETAHLTLTTDMTANELAEIFARSDWNSNSIEVIEVAKRRITIEISPRQVTSDDREDRESAPHVPDDGRIRVAIVGFDDPYRSGVEYEASGFLTNIFTGLDAVSAIQLSGMIPNGSRMYGQPHSAGSGSGEIARYQPDWIAGGTINHVSFEQWFTPPIYDREDGDLITPECHYKRGEMSVSVEVFDAVTGQVLFSNTYSNTRSSSSRYYCSLESNQSMIRQNWIDISNVIGVDLMEFLFTRIDTPCYISMQDPENPNRAITPLNSGHGMYPELPMRIYVPSSTVDWEEDVGTSGWYEVCKVTVKEVYSDHSVIEVEEKWFEYFEFGAGNNVLWPVRPDRW